MLSFVLSLSLHRELTMEPEDPSCLDGETRQPGDDQGTSLKGDKGKKGALLGFRV